MRVGPDVAYVHPETADLLEQQRGGVSGALADAGAKAKGAVGEATDGAKAATADAKPEDALLGKRTGRDVEDDNGAVVVPAGRRVTGDDIERARAADKLPDLPPPSAWARRGWRRPMRRMRSAQRETTRRACGTSSPARSAR